MKLPKNPEDWTIGHLRRLEAIVEKKWDTFERVACLDDNGNLIRGDLELTDYLCEVQQLNQVHSHFVNAAVFYPDYGTKKYHEVKIVRT